jgi:hypothetical protein
MDIINHTMVSKKVFAVNILLNLTQQQYIIHRYIFQPIDVRLSCALTLKNSTLGPEVVFVGFILCFE